MDANSQVMPSPTSKPSCYTGAAITIGCMGMLLFAAGAIILAFYLMGSPDEGDDTAGGGGGSILGDLFGGNHSSAEPVRARFDGDRPVGLYFMTRYWSYTGTLEKAAWYFAPDGRVYRNLENGFSESDLAAQSGQRGTFEVDGDAMTVTWSDGKSTTNELERDDTGFGWDMGIFIPVEPFSDEDELVGTWEGGESLSHGGSHVSVAKTLELREDGTFTWDAVSFVERESAETELSASAGGSSSGTYRLSGHSLLLTDTSGVTIRGIAFPYDDEETPVKPDRFFFRGTMYKQR